MKCWVAVHSTWSIPTTARRPCSPNRHRLQRELQHALEHAAQTGSSLALLYLDLDGFKAANDRGGHEAGDRLLREVADRLKQGLRQDDLVDRVAATSSSSCCPAAAMPRLPARLATPRGPGCARPTPCPTV